MSGQRRSAHAGGGAQVERQHQPGPQCSLSMMHSAQRSAQAEAAGTAAQDLACAPQPAHRMQWAQQTKAWPMPGGTQAGGVATTLDAPAGALGCAAKSWAARAGSGAQIEQQHEHVEGLRGNLAPRSVQDGLRDARLAGDHHDVGENDAEQRHLESLHTRSHLCLGPDRAATNSTRGSTAMQRTARAARPLERACMSSCTRGICCVRPAQPAPAMAYASRRRGAC